MAGRQWSDWDAEAAGFECESGVGITIKDDVHGSHIGSRWLSWDETRAMYQWLGQKIKDAEDVGAPTPTQNARNP